MKIITGVGIALALCLSSSTFAQTADTSSGITLTAGQAVKAEKITADCDVETKALVAQMSDKAKKRRFTQMLENGTLLTPEQTADSYMQGCVLSAMLEDPELKAVLDENIPKDQQPPSRPIDADVDSIPTA